MTIWCALLLAIPQEGAVRDLIQKLDDDSIDVRMRAAEELGRLSPSTVPTLREAARKASGEARELIHGAIRKIGEAEQLAKALPEPTLITLEARAKPLREVVDVLQKSSPLPIHNNVLAGEHPLSVSLTGVPFWKALDEICRASGRGDFKVEGGKVEVFAIGRPSRPSAFAGPLMATVRDVTVNQGGRFLGGEKRSSLHSSILVRWEQKAMPSHLSWRFVEVADEHGTRLFDPADHSVAPAHGYAPTSGFEYTLVPYLGLQLAPETGRTARVTLEVLCRYTLESATVRIPSPESKAGGVERCDQFSVTLPRVRRDASGVSLNVQIALAAVPTEMVPLGSLKFRDKAGRTGSSALSGLSFASHHGGTFDELEELSVTIPLKVHTERIPIEMKDLPIR